MPLRAFLSKSVEVVDGKGGHCNYRYAVNLDGSIDANTFETELFPPTFQFPPPTSTPVGAAGDITTKDVSTFFFPPAFLYFPIGKHLTGCCIGGFHFFDFEPGDATNGNLPRVFVLNYSTWDQPIFQSPSTAIHGAYSYPDITTLTALSAPQKAGCAP
jgi:hypothetical protein